MKILIQTDYIFDASARTVNLTSIPNFDVKKLYAILNITRNQVIYAIGTSAFGLASISGDTLTLVYDTTSQADTDELGIIYDNQVTKIPADDIDSVATAVRALPQHVSRIGFAKTISNGVDTDFFESPTIGAGMTVNQIGGNLVITSGTTARSETLIRSRATWKGGIRLRARSTLSQRIINQNFIVELVDVIGDGLAYVINSATSITVTIPNNTLTAANVGQSVSIGLFAGVSPGTFLSGRYPIASVVGDAVTFTVSGFAVGSGTCSLFGMNFYRILYQGTTATNLTFNTARNGYQNTDVNATINTTASPGHMAVITGNDLEASLHDQLVASGTGVQLTLRATAVENIPDDKDLRVQIRVLNLGTAPASGTTWTIGLISVGNYANQDVLIQGIKPMSPVPIPVDILRSVAIGITGTVTTSGTVTANVGTSGLTVFTDSSTNLGISAAFTGTSRDGGATPAFNLFTVNAVADQAGTVRIEKSTDNTTWRRATADVAVAANVGVDLTTRVTARYYRVVYTNGGVAQTQFLLTSAYQRQ